MKSIRTVKIMKKFFIKCFKRNIGIFLVSTGILLMLVYRQIPPVDSNIPTSIASFALFVVMIFVNYRAYVAEIRHYNLNLNERLSTEYMYKAENLHLLNVCFKICQGICLLFAMLFIYQPFYLLIIKSPLFFYKEIPVLLCAGYLLLALGGIILATNDSAAE